MRRRPSPLLSAFAAASMVGCPGPGTPTDGGPDDARTAADAGDGGGGATWRSALYPATWSPATTDEAGRFLHDFSYAGYRNGERPIGGDDPSGVFDVVADFGADPTGSTDGTVAVQAAVDAAGAAGGGVVRFPAGDFRFDGTLTVGRSSVVLRGAGSSASRLHFTASEGLSYGSHITFRGNLESDLELPLDADAEPRGFTVSVADAGDLAVGEDVAVGWIISPEFVDEHGMTGTWEAFNDTWQPFFRRQVVAIDRATTPHVITLDVPLRYPARVRDGASVRRERGYLRDCAVEGLGVANAVSWEAAWSEDQVHALEMSGVADCWIRDLASFPSLSAPSTGDGAGAHLQSSGLLIRASKRVTVAESRLGEVQNRGPGGNGYLFEVRQSSEILFRDCDGLAGRHNFIQNWGFGTSGCVWLRIHSADGLARSAPDGFPVTGLCELHHSLATANLVDGAVFDDGWAAVNRHGGSTGAGHTGTENVLWRVNGEGVVRSFQYGVGYVIGTGPGLEVATSGSLIEGDGAEPDDWTEGLGAAEGLEPVSLYEDQLTRRLGR